MPRGSEAFRSDANDPFRSSAAKIPHRNGRPTRSGMAPRCQAVRARDAPSPAAALVPDSKGYTLRQKFFDVIHRAA
jgi:hypothetical protein